nr:reductive dehalogenase [uncultured bacterium]
MTKHHSTISRRDFMKTLGLGSVGLGMSALVAPAFHDLDEMMASPMADFKRPSWVKETNKPTVDIDWKLMGQDPYDGSDCMWEKGYVKAVGETVANAIKAQGAENRIKWIKEKRPGFTDKDWAFNASRRFFQTPDYLNPGNQTFLGPQTAPTLTSMGLPRYEGTPEENARMVRTFLKVHGCSEVAFCELDTNTTEKILYKCDAAGIPYFIRDQDQPEEVIDPNGKSYRVIPKRARSVIVYTMRMAPELLRRVPTYLSYRAAFIIYEQQCLTQSWLQQFMRALGYMCLGWHRITSSLGSTTGFGVMAGLGEMGRTQHLITPEHGQTERVFCAITDMPLAPGRPIDFGAFNFCKTCKKCAELCPSRSMSTDTEPTWEKRGFYQRSGVKAWWRYEPGCRSWMYNVDNSCGKCISVCPFSKLYKAPYHDVVREISSNTTLLNRFLRQMDDFLGFGARPEEDFEKFWDMDVPPWGYE